MPYSLQLHFDEATDQRVRCIWESLQQAGLPSRPIEYGHYPHVTLLFGESDRPEELQEILMSDGFAQEGFEILFASLSTFANDGGVVLLGPVVTRQLIDLHQSFWERFNRAFGSSNPFYVPGRWFPHCTLATRLSRIQITSAFDVLSDLQLPFSGRAVSLNIVKYPESHLLQGRPLAAG